MGKQWLTLFFWAPKITADGDCSHEIKRHLLLRRKTKCIKKQRHHLPTKVLIVKAMVFPVVMYRCESWTIKKAKCQRNDAYSSVWLCDPVNCNTPGFPVLHHLLEFAQTHVHWVSDAIQPSYPLSSPSPFTFNLSQLQSLFQWLHSSHQVAKILDFRLQHHPSNEYSKLISFRMDWLDLRVVQWTLKSLLQHHSSKASIFSVQLCL